LLVFLAVRRFGLAIYVFFVTSYVAASVDIGAIQSVLNFLPLTMEDRALGYVNLADPSSSIESIGDGKVWFLTLNNFLMSLFVLLASTLLFMRGVHKAMGLTASLFLFGMLLYGATNFVAYVPSAIRFYNIGEMLIIAAVILFLSDVARTRKLDAQIVNGLWPLLCINIALGIRSLLVFSSVYLLIGNFFIAPFVAARESLFEIVKLLL